MTDLDRLDVLAAAATPGPWFRPKLDAALREDEDGGDTLVMDYTYTPTEADAAFIAACDPATIRSLVAAVRERDELRAENDILRQALAAATSFNESQAAVEAALQTGTDPTRPGFTDLEGFTRAALHSKDGAS